MSEVHLFRPHYRTDEVLAEVRECLETGWTGLGFKTLVFEDAWREYTGLPHAHFLNSATSGLHLAVRQLKETDGWEAGDEIITSPLTFVSTNHVILHENLRPIFADVDEFLCLDPDSVAGLVTPRTRAVCFVGFGGNPGRFREIRDLCRHRGLRLILDAAHMAGTWFDLDGERRHAGRGADAAVFSFHAVKNLPTADGGMLCFSDAELDREARKWSWLGISKDTYSRTASSNAYRWRYEVEHVGFKYHGNSVMAAMGLVALRYLEQDNEHRRQLAAVYDRQLARAPAIERVPMAPGCIPSRHLYQVLVEDRDDVVLALNERKIYPGVHYRDNTEYPMYAHDRSAPFRARDASRRILSLPLHLGLSEDEVRWVARSLVEIVESRRGDGDL